MKHDIEPGSRLQVNAINQEPKCDVGAEGLFQRIRVLFYGLI